MTNNNPYITTLKPLIGGKVKHIIVDPSPNGDVFMGLVVEVGKKTYEVIGLSDAEGNGAGFLQVTKISDYSKNQVETSTTSN